MQIEPKDRSTAMQLLQESAFLQAEYQKHRQAQLLATTTVLPSTGNHGSSTSPVPMLAASNLSNPNGSGMSTTPIPM